MIHLVLSRDQHWKGGISCRVHSDAGLANLGCMIDEDIFSDKLFAFFLTTGMSSSQTEKP